MSNKKADIFALYITLFHVKLFDFLGYITPTPQCMSYFIIRNEFKITKQGKLCKASVIFDIIAMLFPVQINSVVASVCVVFISAFCIISGKLIKIITEQTPLSHMVINCI